MNKLLADFHWDFAVLLTLATAITGLVWTLDKLVLGKKRRAGLAPGVADRPSWFVDFCVSFFPVIAFVLFLRSFIVEPFRIPSGSMIPTLHIGDFILVNKFAYGVRDPVFHQKFWGHGKLERGDIAVFRYPPDPSMDYIKRIIGLPGDHIEYRDKQLFINGQSAPQVAEGEYDSPHGVIYRLREDFLGLEHSILVNPSRPSDNFEFTVPEGQYFGMGDNRDGSADSRYWGTVPEKNLAGRAFFIWMSWNSEADWLHKIEVSRIGTVIK